MRTLFLLILAAVPAAYSQKKAPQPKPPIIDVVEATAHRDQDELNIDGKVKNSGERAATDLVVFVDVLDAQKRVLTTQSGGSDPASIEAGEEGEFHARMPLPAKAVYIRFNFEEPGGRYLKATNTGPFAID